MKTCEFCGKKIGLLTVKYTWINKKITEQCMINAMKNIWMDLQKKENKNIKQKKKNN